MKVLVAPDGFKGSLSASAAAERLGEGLAAGWPQLEPCLLPIADGGEGTTEALVRARGGTLHPVEVSGPLGQPVQACYGVLPDGVAVVECAQAAGLTQVPPDQRDPARTTTFGLGELLLQAVGSGCREVVLGLGGSATVDGGAGLAQALGYRLLDAAGQELPRGGGALVDLARIERPPRDPLQGVRLRIAGDVDNPLLGPQGAAPVYGPQKGASPAQVETLAAGLARLAERWAVDLARTELGSSPGGGAAGGLGAGLQAFAGGVLEPGAELVFAALELDRHLADARLVVTGEGRVDEQTGRAKGPFALAQRARSRGLPVVAVAGSVGPGAEALVPEPFAAVLPLVDGPQPLEQALAEAPRLLRAAGERLARLLRLGRTLPGGEA